jgi:hypothetical protein
LDHYAIHNGNRCSEEHVSFPLLQRKIRLERLRDVVQPTHQSPTGFTSHLAAFLLGIAEIVYFYL